MENLSEFANILKESLSPNFLKTLGRVAAVRKNLELEKDCRKMTVKEITD